MRLRRKTFWGDSMREFLPLGVWALLAAGVAGAATESELLGVLQSDVSDVLKAEACKQLRLVGTAASVSALSALLTHDALSHAARHALEAIPGPEADAAMRDALGRTIGLLRAGIADSLGWRGDPQAVRCLKPLMADSNAVVAAAAARALGRIGGREAVAALRAAQGRVRAEARPAVSEALLQLAQIELAAGKIGPARSVFARLAKRSEPEHVRVAAHVGLLRCAGARMPERLRVALAARDPAAQLAALEVARTSRDPGVTRAVVAALPRVQPPLQIALLELLRWRGEELGVSAAREAARSSDAAVRAAAWRALGDLGGATDVPLLAAAATSTDAVEQKAAREALAFLRRGAIAEALIAHARHAPMPQRIEIFRALAERAESTAVPALLDFARAPEPEARRAALKALSRLVAESDVVKLGELLVRAPDEGACEEVLSVFESLAERCPKLADAHGWALVSVLTNAPAPLRPVAFRVYALFVSGPLREALGAGLRDADAGIRTAAARALCDARDAALLPALTALAGETDDAGLRSQAIAGAVRLASETSADLSLEQRAAALETVWRLAVRVEDKRRVLSGLARVPCARTLALAEQAANDPEVRAEAEAARKQIAEQLAKSDP